MRCKIKHFFLKDKGKDKVFGLQQVSSDSCYKRHQDNWITG